MRKLILSNLLILVIFLALFLAFLLPGSGEKLKTYGLDGLFIIVIFFCQGALLEVRKLLDCRSHVKTLTVGAVGAYVLAPAMGYWLGRIFALNGSDMIGFVLICSMTPTIVSGIVMSAKAGGERDTAILLTVALSFLGLFAIPFNLSWALQTVTQIDQVSLLKKILFTILAPACAGQVVRRFYPPAVTRFPAFYKHAPVVLLGLVVYVSLSSHAARLADLSPRTIGILVLLTGTVHLVILTVGYFASRYLLRIDRAKSRSAAVVSSQKSIAVAIPIWSAAFAAQYPLSLVPAIVYHFLQLLLDAGIANYWSKKSQETLP